MNNKHKYTHYFSVHFKIITDIEGNDADAQEVIFDLAKTKLEELVEQGKNQDVDLTPYNLRWFDTKET